MAPRARHCTATDGVEVDVQGVGSEAAQADASVLEAAQGEGQLRDNVQLGGVGAQEVASGLGLGRGSESADRARVRLLLKHWFDRIKGSG